MKSGAPEGSAIPAPLVIDVESKLFQCDFFNKLLNYYLEPDEFDTAFCLGVLQLTKTRHSERQLSLFLIV